jgi:hypothetical protein
LFDLLEELAVVLVAGGVDLGDVGHFGDLEVADQIVEVEVDGADLEAPLLPSNYNITMKIPRELSR